MADPPDCGLKVTLKDALCPAARVTGKLSPPMVKPSPETLAWDTVTSEPPELVSAAARVCPWPTCTLPKFRLEGFEMSEPVAVTTAVTGTVTTGVPELLLSEMVPVEVPAACARKGHREAFALAR